MSAEPGVAITGASGMLGSHLCHHFARRGWSVRALLREPERASSLPSAAARHLFELGREVHAEALQGATVLIHCAATTRSHQLTSAAGVDETAARLLLDQARSAGVERIVFASSTSARADAPSEYGRSKHAIERMLSPRDDLALRLGLVLARDGGGLFRRMVEWVAGGRLIPLFGGGRQPVQPIHVDDVCRAVEAGLVGGHAGTLTIAAPEGMALRSLLETIARRLERRVLFVPAPFAPTLVVLRAIEALRLPFPITSENLLGLREQRFLPARADLDRLGLEVLSVERALEDALATGPRA